MPRASLFFMVLQIHLLIIDLKIIFPVKTDILFVTLFSEGLGRKKSNRLLGKIFSSTLTEQAISLSMLKQGSQSPGVHHQTVLMDNLTTTLLRLPLHLKNGTNPLTAKPTPTYLFGYLEMMSLYIRGAFCTAMFLCVCACAKEDSQGHYSLIRHRWSTHVIFSAWGLPRASSTISHLSLTIYPSNNHPSPNTVAEMARESTDERQPPQHCLRWVLMKSLDISLLPHHLRTQQI